jgi:sucrose phosphorylase
MNITYPSALARVDSNGGPDPEDTGIARFLCSQAVALSMRGVPAVYFHSLFGVLNDEAAADAEGGEPRSINRRKWDRAGLADLLIESETREASVFGQYTAMLRRRADQPAFHPDAGQTMLDFGTRILAFLRFSLDGTQRILCVFNFTSAQQLLPAELVEKALGVTGPGRLRNLMTGRDLEREGGGALPLEPHGSYWISGT